MEILDCTNEFPCINSNYSLVLMQYSPKSDYFEDFVLIYQILCGRELL
jgi:hypothetical protein